MSLAAHLPVLAPALPLLAAPLAMLSRSSGFANAIVTIAAWLSFACAAMLWGRLDGVEAISYHIGSWPPPWGIEYRIDRLSAFMMLLVSGVAGVVLPYSRVCSRGEIADDLHYLHFTMFALCLAGLLGIVATNDAFNLFVFLEVSSLSSYVLIAMGRDRRALTAAWRYLMMGSIGATFIVIGIGFLYLTTGTLNLTDMAQRLGAVRDARPVLAALAFITVGVSLKLALFPLHQWLPGAYTHAPSAVSAFLAATATKVSVYMLIRFHFTVFGEALVFQQWRLPLLLLALSLLAMVAASFVAVFQNNLKRLFAWSSIGQIGYITLGLSFDSVNGVAAAIAHLANHGLAKGAIFLFIGAALAALRQPQTAPPEPTLAQFAGLGRRMPLTCLGIVIAALSLIGVPGSAGFISKWYLLLAALEQQQYIAIVAIAVSSLLAAAYVWRFIEAAWFDPAPDDDAAPIEPPLALLAPAWLLTAATIWFGLEPSLTLGGALDAAQQIGRAHV